MTYLKKLVRALLFVLVISTLLTFIITIFSYFNIFSDNLTKVLKLMTPIIGVFSGGIVIGRRSNKKGFVEGIKLALIIDIILIIISLISGSLNVESILFYLILLISTIFGSMIGIQKKVKTNSLFYYKSIVTISLLYNLLNSPKI